MPERHSSHATTVLILYPHGPFLEPNGLFLIPQRSLSLTQTVLISYNNGFYAIPQRSLSHTPTVLIYT